MKKYFLLLLVILFFCINKTKAQWSLVPGLPAGEYGYIYAFNDTLYAGKGNLVYMSYDGGISWTASNVIQNDIDFISVIFKINNRLFAGTYNHGVFITTNYGSSWIPFSTGLSGSKDIRSIAGRGDSIYAGTIGSSIFAVDINGSTWTPFNENIPMNISASVNSLYNYNGRLITGSGMNAQIYYNDYGSSHWNEIQYAPFNPLGSAMLAIAGLDNFLYGAGSQGLYKSSDGGLNWEFYDPAIGYIGNASIVVYDQSIVAMLAKAGSTYYYKYNNVSNEWIFFDSQPGIGTYNFTIVNNRIFSAGFNGLYYRSFDPSDLEEIKNTPDEYQLHQNYPNPFNSSTKIKYQISSEGNVEIKVFDLLGREVSILVNEFQQPGSYTLDFSASDNLAAGVYFYKIKTKEFTSIRKMILLK